MAGFRQYNSVYLRSKGGEKATVSLGELRFVTEATTAVRSWADMRSREFFLYWALVLLPLGEGVLCPLWRPGVTWHCPSSVSCSSQRALASTADSTVIERYIGWQFPQSAYTAKTGPDVLSQSLFILVNTAARYPIVHSYILPLPMLIPGNSFFWRPYHPYFLYVEILTFFFLNYVLNYGTL